MNLALYKIVVDRLNELLTIENTERSNNLYYIAYIDDWYGRESGDLNFVHWLDTGYTALKTWETMLTRFVDDLSRLSIESFVKTIRSSDLVTDLNAWMLNFQNFRSNFNNGIVDDARHRVDHLYLRLTTIIVEYDELTARTH